jgi:ribosomal protein S18 acetylase RimI-like enzyme
VPASPEEAAVAVRRLQDGDRAWLRDLLDRSRGLPVVSISGVYDPSTLSGFVAAQEERRLGAVTYRLAEQTCEVVTLNSLEERRGVGSALLSAVRRVADEGGRRLWLITTNDNVNALRFYQRRGMDMRALHRDFVDVVRRHKAAADVPTAEAIAFRHAVEFSY